jgi:plastocyanin
MSTINGIPSQGAAGLLFATLTLAGGVALQRTPGDPAAVSAKLSEWKVELSQPSIAAGLVTFTVTNAGSVPHAFEVEGQGIEKETEVIQPGASATLKLTLKPGNYDVYCPVGGDSHKHLGMETHLKVVAARAASPSAPNAGAATPSPEHGASEAAPKAKAIRVNGAGPMVQILTGPGEPKLDAPGGFLFVNWEKSSALEPMTRGG